MYRKKTLETIEMEKHRSVAPELSSQETGGPQKIQFKGMHHQPCAD